MTREEAIRELREDKALYETDNCHAGDGSPDGDLLEALDMAIETLSADTVSREAHYDAVANRITDMEERGFVSVVRCKDCVWSKEWNDNQIFCDRILMRLRETDFCSYGERIDDQV